MIHSDATPPSKVLDALAALVRDLYEVGLLPIKFHRQTRWTGAARMVDVLGKWPETEWRPIVRIGRHTLVLFRDEPEARP